MTIVFIGAAIGAAFFVLRWALSAIVPEHNLRQADRAISKSGKTIALIWLVGMVMFFLYIVFIYTPSR